MLWKDRGKGGKRKGREAIWAAELVHGRCFGLHEDMGSREEPDSRDIEHAEPRGSRWAEAGGRVDGANGGAVHGTRMW